MMIDNKEIMILDEQSLKEKVYWIRDQQVMLDYDLAQIYGYTTTRFNEQIARNIDRFDDDFMFQLTKEEFQILISQNATSSWGGRRKLPRAFTEQGIYMLMTVLKSPYAIIQSKKLIRLFKSMKDFIIDNQSFMLPAKDYVSLTQKINHNTDEILNIKSILNNVVTKDELSDFMNLFNTVTEYEEILVLNGEPFKADLAYQRIYHYATKNLIIIDDYINIKTLHHLLHSKKDVKLTIFSDNKARPPLRESEYADFKQENPCRNIDFIRTLNNVHDRYIVVDYNTKDMKVYHCGASSKDAGKKITTITRINDIERYHDIINNLFFNPSLVLR